MNSTKALLCALACIGSLAQAADKIGQTYAIGEEAADQAILRKLREKQSSGELPRLQQEAVNRTVATIKTPPAVQGVGRALTYRASTIDPSVTHPRDVLDDLGHVIVKAGTTVNPLEVMPLTKTLLFFDGRDPAQVAAARRFVAGARVPVKPILVAGSWFELTKTWKRQVFHDQGGALTRRFGVTAVPATLRQQGNRLLLEEIPTQHLLP